MIDSLNTWCATRIVIAVALWIANDALVQSQSATPPAEIHVPTGFQIDLLYSVPLDEQGSWVCMTEDPQGRLICGDQRGGLYRMTIKPNGAPPAVESLDIDIGHAQGMVCAYDSLYVVVSGPAAEGTGFYRVRDTDGDDQYDEITLLKKFERTGSSAQFDSMQLRIQNMMISSGHGPHGVCLGPDGMLYIIGGNHTRVPQDVSAESPFRNWGEDLLLPRIPDAQGIATGIRAPGGWVLKTDSDGKQWTLVCGGLRNAYDLAFNRDGELFTFDSDMEFDVGAPWYRPCRINHLVPGGDYGWRYGSGKWPDYFADSIGSVVDIGFASPTGIAFGYAAKFPSRYRQSMFVGDWAYGKIFAVQLTPEGASYRGSFEVFAAGKPLAITDLTVHSDGALYFVIGGRNTQSGVYRIRYAGNDSTDLVATESTGENERELRRQLESLSCDTGAQLELAFDHLNSDDRMIRSAARLALERMPVSAWQQMALSETHTTATIHAVIGLARCADSSLQQQLLDKLNELPFEQLSDTQLLDALRAYSLVFVRLGGKSNTDLEAVATRLLPLLPSPSPHVNRELVRLLVYLESTAVIDHALELMRSSESQENQMFFAFMLRNAADGWSIEQRKQYFSWLRFAHENFKGGQSFQGFVRRTLSDAVKTLSAEEKLAVADIIRGRETIANSTQITQPRTFVHNWQISDLLPNIDNIHRGRSFASGKQAYQAAQCDKCHRMHGVGGDTGPDLTGVGNRFSVAYLLEAIITPSKVIPEQYQNWRIATDDGDVIVGRIVFQDDQQTTLRTHPFATKNVVIATRGMIEQRLSEVSEMPQGLVNTLSADEILDLVAYLRAAGDPDDPAFFE